MNNRFTNGLRRLQNKVSIFDALYYCKILCLMLLTGLFTTLTADAQEQKHRATVLDANGMIVDEDDYTGVHVDDSLALVALYHSAQGDHWVDNSGWLVDRVDFWIGVDQVENVGTETEPEWRVTRIDMERYNMTRPGVLPQDLGNMEHLQRFSWISALITHGMEVFEGMDHLERLVLRNTPLTGEIPWDIYSELPRLERLQLHNAPQYSEKVSLSGGIDPVIGEFPRLQRIHFAGAGLTGELPAELTNIESLQRISIHRNNFTGGWDHLSGLADLPDFERWDVYENPFAPGPIPEWLCDIEKINQIRLYNTNRTGTIPQCIAEIPDLVRFGFGEGIWRDEAAPHSDWQGEGMLSGEIPDFSNNVNMERFRIYGPGFSGPVPDWIGNFTNLTHLKLIDTAFEGDLPGNIFNIPTLEWIIVKNNDHLTGGFPLQMQGALNLETIRFAQNPKMEIGEFPAWIGDLERMEQLALVGMGVTGSIPDGLQNASSLDNLVLRDNPGLTGEIPNWLPDMNLLRLELDRTGMDVPEVPTWIADLPRGIIRLGLAGLGIEGEIPAWLGDLNTLTYLALDGNNFSGEIPSELGNLLVLDSLSLANNNLEGEIPEELIGMGRITEDFNSLRTLDISGNENLTGSVPTWFTSFNQMRVLNYDGTGLCEPQDQAFHDWLETIPENSYVSYPPLQSSVGRTNTECPPTNAELTDIPERFVLHQNYPNPFNPVTTIKYEIPADVQVTLKVYNVIGQNVATLVNSTQSAGSYEVSFDAANMASGTYIYRLEAGDQSTTQSMMLMK